MTDIAEKPSFAAALGKIPSGLFILTVAGTTGETGFLASWIQQCSFDPPQLTFAIGKSRPVLEELHVGVAVGVNVIPEGGKALIAHFGAGFAPGVPAFKGIEKLPATDGAPGLAAALAYLDTRVVSLTDVGDHILVLTRIVDGRVMHDGKPTIHLRRDGLKY